MSKYALVVGISEYQDPLICDPPFASRDAEKLGECLEGDCGFDDVRVLSTGSGDTISSGEISKELIALRALMKVLARMQIFLRRTPRARRARRRRSSPARTCWPT